MTTASLALTEDLYEELRSALLTPTGKERAGYLLCSLSSIASDLWDGQAHKKYIGNAFFPVPENEVISSSAAHVEWSTDSFVRMLKTAQDEGLVPAIVHTHPAGVNQFSAQDDQNEPDLVKLAQNRNGNNHPLISLILTQTGEIVGRVWFSPKYNVPLRMIRIFGNRFRFSYPGRGQGATPEAFARQALAFGPALTQDFHKMRVTIVGQGATGSATAKKAAHLGIGQLALIDKDIVESSNLSRLQGATQSDADGMRYKADVVAESIARMGLGVRAIPVKQWVGHPDCRDILKSSDVIFGCTDDNEGRMLLNRLAHFYMIPVIDMGLAFKVSDTTPPVIQDLAGRITVVFPGAPCLLCHGVIDIKMAHAEALKRANPTEYERQKQEAYVLGEGNPSPAVITFTDDVANMALNELIHRMTGYRGAAGDAWSWRRRYHHMEDRKAGPASKDPECPICASKEYWGKGDVEPFLDRVG